MPAGKCGSSSRENDDRLLRALHLRVEAKFTAKEAAEATGLNRNTIIRAHREIIAADLAMSGEPRAVVLAEYWENAG